MRNALGLHNKCFIFLQREILKSKLSGILYYDAGEVSEWLIEPVSKTGVFFWSTAGSNPALSAIFSIRKSGKELKIEGMIFQ